MTARHWRTSLLFMALALGGREGGAVSQAPQAHDCGTVSVQAQNPPSDAAAGQVERCFLSAYSACRTDTTMTLETHGVDTLSKATLTITGGSPCGIAGTVETTTVPRRRTSSAFTCARLTPKDGGLLFEACGRFGDIFVAPPTP